jgi:ketosteroid isomerase-like protein
MSTPQNLQEFLDKLYTALSTGDVETWVSMHSPNALFNIAGDTIISGQVPMPQLLSEVFPLVFGALDPATARLGLRWKLMCADDKRATVIFEGESTTKAGESYNNRYIQILEFGEDGLIHEVWEYFDTPFCY